MSCVFLATFSVEGDVERVLETRDLIMIVVVSNIVCLSIPSVPSGSIVAVLVVLNEVNIKSTNIALLYTVEWLLDR